MCKPIGWPPWCSRSSWPSSPRSRSCDSTHACSRATSRLSASCCFGHADRHTNTGASARTQRSSRLPALYGGLLIPNRPICELPVHLVRDKANRSRRDRRNSNRHSRPYPKRLSVAGLAAALGIAGLVRRWRPRVFLQKMISWWLTELKEQKHVQAKYVAERFVEIGDRALPIVLPHLTAQQSYCLAVGVSYLKRQLGDRSVLPTVPRSPEEENMYFHAVVKQFLKTVEFLKLVDA